MDIGGNMKTKSALFLSAALTAFVLAIVASVFGVYNAAKTSEVAAAASPTQVVVANDAPTQPDPTAAATVTEPTQVGPVQAASLAAQYMNKTDVYSVESTTVNGVTQYMVVFSSGDIVYVGLDGKIISTAAAQPTVAPQPTTVSSVPLPPTPAPKHRSGGGGGGGGGGGEGEGGDG
jgi:hypothetical protein